MNAYELSNMKISIVESISDLATGIKAHSSTEDNISLDFRTAEKIRDCLCDANDLFSILLRNTDVANTSDKPFLPFE